MNLNEKVLFGVFLVSLNLFAWQKDGVPIATGPYDQTEPRLVTWGKNFVVVYKDLVPNIGPKLRAAMVDGEMGERSWDVSVVDDTTTQYDDQIVVDSSGMTWVVFEKWPNASTCGISIQKLSPNGDKMFDKEGLDISFGVGNRYAPQLCLDGSGEGCYVAWTDYRSGNPDVRTARVTKDGQVAWEVPVCSLVYQETVREIVSSGQGCIIFWWDGYRDPPGLYGQRLVDSLPQWDINGKLIIPFNVFLLFYKGSVAGEKKSIHALPDDHGGAITFADYSAQRVDSLGNLLWNPPPKISLIGYNPVSTASTEDSGIVGCDIAWGGTAPFKYFYLVKVTSTGALPWGESLRVWTSSVLDTTTSTDYFTSITSDYHSGGIVAFAPVSAKGDKNIRVLRTDSSGLNVWEKEVCQAEGDQDYPIIVHEPSSKGYLVIWQDMRMGNWDIYGSYIDSLGMVGISEAVSKKIISHSVQVSITPNPFTHRTEIHYRDFSSSRLNLKIYDFAGQLVKTFPETKNKYQRIIWDGQDDLEKNLPAGIYFLKAGAGDKMTTRKIILIR